MHQSNWLKQQLTSSPDAEKKEKILVKLCSVEKSIITDTFTKSVDKISGKTSFYFA